MTNARDLEDVEAKDLALIDVWAYHRDRSCSAGSSDARARHGRMAGLIHEALDREKPRDQSAVSYTQSLTIEADKYDDVLIPFLYLMRNELHANAGKGDRAGWLQMDSNTALLEIYYHLAKLQKAVRKDNPNEIREYAADVANMAMMALDICDYLDVDEG